MGLELFGDPGSKIPVVIRILNPHDIDVEAVRADLLHHFEIVFMSSFWTACGTHMEDRHNGL